MKLRIRENTVRVRLTQTEVARLAAGHRVVQSTTFSPTSKLVTTVDPSPDVSAVGATFEYGHLTVWLPADRARAWAGSDEVGIESEARGPEALHILVEKDFQCLHSDEESVPDAFPNPRTKAP